jgi:hypothetical protein
MNFARLTLTLLILGGCPTGLTLACPYNVRDTGFLDWESDSYWFYGFVCHDTPPESVLLFQELSAAALRHNNIRVALVNTSLETNHPALKHLPAGALPVAILISPDGQSLPFSLSGFRRPFRQSLHTALQEIVTSPKREEILETVSQALAAILLIEGDNAGENRRARQAITDAIREMSAQMQGLPKAAIKPPAVRVIEASSYGRERVLLWSLGLDTARTSQPRAAIIYGRARWIGPLMKGEEITARNLVGILSIIGADCECDLDVAWALGTRLPVRWAPRLHSQAVEALGFDPENPLVKLELSRIINRRRTLGTVAAPTANSAPEEPLKSMAASGSNMSDTEASADASPRGATTSSGPALADTGSVWRTPLILLAGLAALIVVTGLTIVWRAARRQRFE